MDYGIGKKMIRAKMPSQQRENFSIFLRTWRPLWFDFAHHPESIEGRLCGPPVEYSHGRGVSVVSVTLFHGASPVEYRLDQDRVVRPKRYSTGRVIFSRFVIPNSTENFKYVWLESIIALFLWASTYTRGVLQPASGVAL